MRPYLAAELLSRAGLRSALARCLPWSGVLALNYHRIGHARGSSFDRGVVSADGEAFSEQIRFCKGELDLIAPEDLPTALASRKGRYGLITFDDGYIDNYEVAFPILQAERVKATFFVTTGFIDSRRVAWWDEIAWMVRTSTRTGARLPGWTGELPFDEPDRERAIWRLLREYKSLPADATGLHGCCWPRHRVRPLPWL